MSEGNGKLNIAFDASKLDTFQVCECKFNYRYNLNKTSPVKATPLDRGHVIHQSLQTYYSSMQAKEPYELSVKKMRQERDTSLGLSDLPKELWHKITDSLDEYVEYWRVYDQNLTIKEIEMPFMYKLHENEYANMYMIGKIDLVTDDNRYMNLPHDHKSYEREWPVKRLNNQFVNYCIATNSNFIDVNKVGLQTSLPPHEKFKRVPLSYDPLYIEQWKKNTIGVLNRYLDCLVKGEWLMNPTSCDKYNRTCEYYEVCDSSGIEAKVYKLTANYKDTEPWDVTKILETKGAETHSS